MNEMMPTYSLKWAVPFLLSATLLGSCGNSADSADHDGSKSDTLDTTAHESPGLINVGGRLFSVPSPMQTALLIKKLQQPYDKALPMAGEAADKMASKYQQALGLGAYGADLAYVAVHKDGQRALRTLELVQRLSAQLELTNAFDASLTEAFKKSMNNEDSLLRFTGMAYRAADRYLKANDRNDISAFVLAGGWVEGMHLSLSGAGETPAQALVDRIGEQRKSLESLITLLEEADKEKTASGLVAGLKDLLTVYAGVTSTYQYQPPTVDASHKTTFINSTSTVTMAPGTLAAIASKVAALRNQITA